MYMEINQQDRDLAKLRDSLGPLPDPVDEPGFILVSGLPGTGKTYFCRKLCKKYDFCVLESDALRKVIFPKPNYSAEESRRLFSAVHSLLEWLLNRGVPVCFDATNLSESNRQYLYRISERTGARLILVSVEAPPELAYQRLQARKSAANPDSNSDADWEIYRQMKPKAEKIRRNHFIVDTSRDITPVINKIVRSLNR